MTPANATTEIRLIDILHKALRANASDVHITPGARPALRIDGKITLLMEYPILTPEMTQRIAYSVMSEKHRKTLEESGQVDFSFGVKDIGRFRANVFMQRGSVAAAFRRLPHKIMNVKELGLTERVLELCHKSMGLVLVTGPTGSGKSTTLASLIDYINQTFPYHIITIEDPIEYVFHHKKSIVNQREIGEDVYSFADAMRAALREDPDVILVGEMRDLETIEIALRAAETGHLVFGTLHTNTTIPTLTRFTMNSVNTEGNSAIELDMGFPSLTIIATFLLASASLLFGSCSDSMFKASIRLSPAFIIVPNCLQNMERSLSLTLDPKGRESLKALFSPSFSSSRLVTCIMFRPFCCKSVIKASWLG